MIKLTKVAGLMAALTLLSSGCIVVTDDTTGLGGDVVISWTLEGQDPLTGCAEYGAGDVKITLLDAVTNTPALEAAALCSDGSAQLLAVPAGDYLVQIDVFTTNGVAIWGNASLAAISVFDGLVETAPVLDLIDLRASISLDWQFGNGKSCADMGVSTVFVEIRDGANKRVVKMSAPDAKKPCALSVNSSFLDRVIDMQFANPVCSIPANAKSFVLCGITGSKVGISVSAVVDADGQIYEGGSMEVIDIPAGQHTVIDEPLYLDTCNDTNNICANP